MQISSNTYPVARTPSVPTSRREDVQTEDAVASVREVPGAKRQVATAIASLPGDMLQAALRDRPVESGSIFSHRQALAQYADVARQDGGSESVEVLGFDAYA